MHKTANKIITDIKDICIPLYKILIPFVFIVKILEISGVSLIMMRYYLNLRMMDIEKLLTMHFLNQILTQILTSGI